MEDEGKYIRAVGSSDSEDDDSQHSHNQSQKSNESMRSDESDHEYDESAESTSDTEGSSPSPSKNDLMDSSSSQVIKELTPEETKSSTVEKIERLEKVIADLTKRLSTYEQLNNQTRPETNENWSLSVDSMADGIQATVRWDHIRNFPSGVPAHKMWEEWNRFIENFEIAASLGNAVNAAQRSKLLFLCLGQELQGIVRAAKLRPSLTQPDCYSTFVDNVRKYLQSMTDTGAEHDAFAGMKQAPGESALVFHARLQEKVRLCGYSPSDQERFVKNQLLKGLRNADLIKNARRTGIACPALDKTCNGCGRRGHFIATCRRRRVNNVRDANQSHPSGWTDEEREDNKQINALSLNDVLIDCSVGLSSPITFLIDSGADVNIIGGNDWRVLKHEFHAGHAKLQPVQPSASNGLHAYGSKNPITINAAFRAEIIVPGTSKPSVEALFYVASEGKLARGLKAKKAFPKVPGIKIKFSVDKSVTPVKNAYYNVPAAFREGARNRLREMETRGIIERVTKAPEWISGMSAVAKGKDDFRLVVNMRGPNKAINREYYRLPLLDEMKVKLHGACYFSKLDLSDAYYHLELCNESRDLTTFLTETGMFRFTRLMFGVNCAPEIFQREMVRILERVENVVVYIDILVYAASLTQLRATVAQVLRILRANNLTINTKKCEFDKTHIKFLGHELDKDGFHIEEAKVRSIQCFREPVTISELRSFLGLASFVSPHVKNFADITSPLWAATTSWSWGPEQKEAFHLVKERIIQSTISQGFFSETDKTILFTDASPVALGAVLVQEDKEKTRRIISFASKALTVIEKKYSQNQREALAAVWAVEHFSYFLMGRHFTLCTDAQGVSFILNRSREDSKRALTRADGWALRLSPYDYDVQYIRGRDNIADASSRLYDGNDYPFNEDISPWEIALLEANAVGFLTTAEITEATAKDEVLRSVIQSLQTGEWSSDLRVYQKLEDNSTTRDGIVIKTGCIVIPEQLRKKALEVAHEGHPSEAKMKSILRQRVWWPGMATDTEKWVQACKTCAVNGRPEKTTPMQRTFAPKVVWETIALDFNGPYIQFGGISILAIVDYRSRYLIAKPVKSTSFHHTKTVLEMIFEREGFPANIKTDNGPPFNGIEYKTYCSERGINAIYSTPLFPQQNGLVENHMKVINKAMSTASTNKTNFVEELRATVEAHNAATHRVTKVAPEEVLTGRKIKRGLPLLRYEGSNVNDELLEQRDRAAKLSSKKYEDARRDARPCRIKPGDEVIIERLSRAKGETRFGPTRFTVTEEKNGNLTLTNDAGQVFKRHVSQTKRIYPWRDTSITASPKQDETSPAIQQQRTTRERKMPQHLKDYVQTVESKQLKL
ncbi:uncharacterized protein K02A2.6-like [Sabethes cyaneus]|uniref:uncharacterized protein K02A2.6-like n=1 Tax=Sabethes cyaneus TaxID=53552 RepID=UPI00237DBCC4|nr:uncharacterized protein K02A2.6-like [Sabethes cyaneus]